MPRREMEYISCTRANKINIWQLQIGDNVIQYIYKANGVDNIPFVFHEEIYPSTTFFHSFSDSLVQDCSISIANANAGRYWQL